MPAINTPVQATGKLIAMGPKLLDQLRDLARQQGHPEPWCEKWVQWRLRFILFHGTRHPKEMGVAEIARFLEHVAATDKDALRSLEVARAALDFLYARVLHRVLGELPLPRPPRLLDQVKQVMRVKHYALRTEECYTQWIKRFILFNGTRHPRDMGAAELELFLTDLAVNGHVSASTQNQALSAIVFLYRDVLGIDLEQADSFRVLILRAGWIGTSEPRTKRSAVSGCAKVRLLRFASCAARKNASFQPRAVYHDATGRLQGRSVCWAHFFSKSSKLLDFRRNLHTACRNAVKTVCVRAAPRQHFTLAMWRKMLR